MAFTVRVSALVVSFGLIGLYTIQPVSAFEGIGEDKERITTGRPHTRIMQFVRLQQEINRKRRPPTHKTADEVNDFPFLSWIENGICIDIDECSEYDGICANGGWCLNLFRGGYKCLCSAGWTGQNCTEDKKMNKNECLPNPCRNGGTCVNKLGSHDCKCPEGWIGPDCQMDVNECLFGLSKCENGATCINTRRGYACICPFGYTGPLCAADINECQQNPCRNGGTCMNNNGSYGCICPGGYTGLNCETDVNECLLGLSDCKNGASCLNLMGGYRCICSHGYNGSLCAEDINECLRNPCLNGGTCFNTPGSYFCRCSQKWVGPICEIATGHP